MSEVCAFKGRLNLSCFPEISECKRLETIHQDIGTFSKNLEEIGAQKTW